MNLLPAPHEGDVRFTCGVHPDPDIPDRGLGAYYACDSLIKEWGDRWETEGKPTERTRFNGHEWALAFDYSESGLDPWESDEYQLDTVREFRFYFVATDSPHYSGEPADRDDRVHGGTITVRPRWPNLTSDGEPVSVPQYGAPYIDVQVQASNIPHRDYHDLAKRAFDAFGISARYLDNPHPDSHVNDLAYYVRLERGESGPLYAPDGPIARAHNLIQGDRSGYRKHEENHTKIPGFKVSAIVEDSKADTLIRGHSLGKELKHYYPKHPDKFDPDQAPHHPKFEVSYQTKRTEGTVRWGEAVKSDDVSFQDARRELQETLLNSLDWAGIAPTADAGIWVDHDPYWQVQNTHESRKLVPDPLPDIEDEQEHRVMQLWGDMTTADKDVTEMLLTDGGKVSPQQAADETGNSYRTIREVVSRLEGLITHTYGELEIESKKIQQELLKRVRAAGERFEQEVGSSVMDLADAADERTRTAWDRARRRYSVTVSDGNDCQKLLRIGYEPQDKGEARRILARLKAAYADCVDSNLFGIDAVITTVEQGQYRVSNLANWRREGYDRDGFIRETRENEKAREDFDFEEWREAGFPPADRWNPD
jgi:hypothetical protein